MNGIEGACNLALSQFTLSGAHNTGSGSFGPMRMREDAPINLDPEGLACYYQNHDISITNMLELGVRHLDMDVSYITEEESNSGEYYEIGIVLVHGLAYSKSLRRALLEINTWLGKAENRNEVVVLRADNHDGEKREEIAGALEEEFRVVTSTKMNPSPNPLLGDAVKRNERLVVFMNKEFEPENLPNMHPLRLVGIVYTVDYTA